MMCNLFGTQHIYQILAVNAFNSDRKRMSILVRDLKTGDNFLFCKGADSVMLELCKLSTTQLEKIDKTLLDLACLGLRTLVVSMKKVTANQADVWATKWRDAAASLENRAENVARVGAEMELELNFLGITAIEDRLQDQVSHFTDMKCNTIYGKSGPSSMSYFFIVLLTFFYIIIGRIGAGSSCRAL